MAVIELNLGHQFYKVHFASFLVSHNMYTTLSALCIQSVYTLQMLSEGKDVFFFYIAKKNLQKNLNLLALF